MWFSAKVIPLSHSTLKTTTGCIGLNTNYKLHVVKKLLTRKCYIVVGNTDVSKLGSVIYLTVGNADVCWDLPDTYTLALRRHPQALGVHIRQTSHCHITTICNIFSGTKHFRGNCTKLYYIVCRDAWFIPANFLA